MSDLNVEKLSSNARDMQNVRDHVRKLVKGELFLIPELATPEYEISKELIMMLEAKVRETVSTNLGITKYDVLDDWEKSELEYSIRIGLNYMLKNREDHLLHLYLRDIYKDSENKSLFNNYLISMMENDDKSHKSFYTRSPVENCTKCKSYYTKYVDYVFGCMSESMSKELAEKHFYDNEPDCPCFDLLESSKENKTSSDLSVVLRQEFNINEDN